MPAQTLQTSFAHKRSHLRPTRVGHRIGERVGDRVAKHVDAAMQSVRLQSQNAPCTNARSHNLLSFSGAR
jgi:hypothetical protein